MTSSAPGARTVPCPSVALDGLGPDFPVSVAASLDAFDLDRIELPIAEDYYARFRRPDYDSGMIFAAEYLSEGFEDPGGNLLCQAAPAPTDSVSAVRLSLPAAQAEKTVAHCFMHAGRPGCITPVHYDWDHSWVAHVCLTGRKRLLFFPPQAGWLLTPVWNMSALLIPRFSEPDRQELVERTGGIEIILEAGEGVAFPSTAWHGVLYDEPSFAISIRFEHHLERRPFVVLPRSWLLQRLVSRFLAGGWAPESSAFLDAYMEEFFQDELDWPNRYRRARDLCRAKLLELGEAQGADTLAGENYSSELALVPHVLQNFYSLEPKTRIDPKPEQVLDNLDYIFEGRERPAFAEKVANYATRLRQGVRPLAETPPVAVDPLPAA